MKCCSDGRIIWRVDALTWWYWSIFLLLGWVRTVWHRQTAAMGWHVQGKFVCNSVYDSVRRSVREMRRWMSRQVLSRVDDVDRGVWTFSVWWIKLWERRDEDGGLVWRLLAIKWGGHELGQAFHTSTSTAPIMLTVMVISRTVEAWSINLCRRYPARPSLKPVKIPPPW